MTEGAGGFDLRASHNESILPGETKPIALGVRVAVPPGHVGLLVVRSSLGKQGMTLANGVGVIDSDYRGELHAVLANLGPERFRIARGDRVAQVVVVPCVQEAELVEQLDATPRGEGGFGSTGKR